MSPNAIPAYGENLTDSEFLSPHRGVHANFLESCSRRISGCFGNTGIPGTPYTGVDVDISTCANPYGGQYLNTRGRNPVAVGLSIANSRLETGVRDVFRVQIALEAKVYLPTSPVSHSRAESRESERAYRDLRNHAAVVDGLYIALLEIPFFSGGISTEQVIPAYSLEYSYPTMPVITALYDIPVRISRNLHGIERIDVVMDTGDGQYKWSSSAKS